MIAAKTFTNPVFNSSFPDPFVLKHRGEYFAYCTGLSSDGRVFSVLHSRDLVNWNALSGAMEPLSTGEPYYWAPEVTYYNGKFYLYYSVGNETLMSIRVAVSERPEGGFVDRGKSLTVQDFAIDAHVFRDDDSSWYMFYATDFLEHSHIGTGTVVDRMIDPFTLEGKPRPVTRAQYDWQVYDPQRMEKGGVRWHTVEGPFLLKRKGIYYEMFSGGNWQNVSYGVSFAVSDKILTVDEWDQSCDGERALPILRTLPGSVVGPGHNSVVVGPNNRELYCVYHRWVNDERVLAIDRMDFAGGNRLFVTGPTYTAQPEPYRPGVNDYFDEGWGERWEITSGGWAASNHEIVATGAIDNEIILGTPGGSFRCEVWVRFGSSTARMGMHLYNADKMYAVNFLPQTREISITFSDRENLTASLRDDFEFASYHHVRLDVDHQTLRVFVDGMAMVSTKELSAEISKIGLFSDGAGCAFSAFSLTGGFEELFENRNLAHRGWHASSDESDFDENSKVLKLRSSGQTVSSVSKNVFPGDHELAVNLRWEVDGNSEEVISFGCGSMFDLINADGWRLRAVGESFALPRGFDRNIFHQFRSVAAEGKIEIFMDETYLGSIYQGEGAAESIMISTQSATVYIDMVRYTLL